MDIIAGDVWEAKLFSSQADQVGINAVYYRFISAGTPNNTDLDLANAVTAASQAPYAAFMSVVTQFWGAAVRRVLPLPETGQIPTSLPPIFGTDAGLPLPAQASGLVTWYTGIGGRKGRGRIYPPFPTNSWIDAGGNMNPAGQAAVETIRAALAGMTAFTGLGGGTALCKLVLFHRAVLIPPTPASTDDITHSMARQKFATQRRRGQTGRPNAIPPF